MFAMNILILETLPPKVHAYNDLKEEKHYINQIILQRKNQIVIEKVL